MYLFLRQALTVLYSKLVILLPPSASVTGVYHHTWLMICEMGDIKSELEVDAWVLSSYFS